MSEDLTATDEPIDESDARTKLAELIEQSEGQADGEGPTFDSPAQARAFGLIVSLWREGVFEWEQFQQQLIDRIATDEGALEAETEKAYYDHWIGAAEQLLESEGHVSSESLEERAVAFAEGERDASEFVIGEREH
jgi:nitrile hydratase accessory protein